MSAEDNIRKAFRLAELVAAHPDMFPDNFVVVPLDPEVLGKLFTPERVRLLRAVRKRRGFSSVGSLAATVRRDPTRVGRDLAVLEGLGLVKLERHGKVKRIRADRRPILLL